MKAFILSAGLGERLGSLTSDTPKVMLSFGGKPILEHLILLCSKYNIREFVINVFWKSEKIIEYFGNGSRFGVRIHYSKEPRLLGTAGAIKRAETILTDTFLILYGDVMMDVDLAKLVAFHKQKHGIGTLVVHKSSHPKDSDLVEIGEKGNIVKFWGRPRFIEPRTRLSNAGLFVLEPSIFQYITSGINGSLETDIFPVLLANKVSLYGYVTREYLIDIGTVQRYRKVKKDMREKISNK